MVEVLTYVFMAISIGPIGSNIPFLRKYLLQLPKMDVGYGRCSSDCQNVKEQVKPKCMTETVEVGELESKNEST